MTKRSRKVRKFIRIKSKIRIIKKSRKEKSRKSGRKVKRSVHKTLRSRRPRRPRRPRGQKKSLSRKFGLNIFGLNLFESEPEPEPDTNPPLKYLNESSIALGEVPVGENPHLKTALLIIDPQNDFVIDSKPAINDMINTIQMLKDFGSKISDIFVSLDTHNRFHIAHPLFWTDRNGNNPKPGTKISLSDVAPEWDPQNPTKWRTTRPEFQQAAYKYIKDLEKYNRFEHQIFPEHCLIGSKGSMVFEPLTEALGSWERKYVKSVRYITKGSESKRDQFSALRSEDHVRVNEAFIKDLETYERVLVCGEVITHCVRFTLEDLLELSQSKIVLLKDAATGTVPNYDNNKYIQDLLEKYPNRFSISETTEVFDNFSWNNPVDNPGIEEPNPTEIKLRMERYSQETAIGPTGPKGQKEQKNHHQDEKPIVFDGIYPINPYLSKREHGVYNGRGPYKYWGPNYFILLIISRKSYNKGVNEYIFVKDSLVNYLPAFDAIELDDVSVVIDTTVLYQYLVRKCLGQIFDNNTNNTTNNSIDPKELSPKLVYFGPLKDQIATRNAWLETSVYLVEITENTYFRSQNINENYHWSKDTSKVLDSHRTLLKLQ
jgi:nicotinamidase-related amidase